MITRNLVVQAFESFKCEVGVDGLGTIASERAEMVNLASLAGFYNQAGLGA